MIKRSDRRTDYSQLRQFAAAQNVLNQADGSARFDIGDTSVLVSVLGPVEVQIRDEKLDEATVEVVVRPAVGVSTTTERLWERYLRTAFEPVILGGLMPRTLVQIVVQILKDDGSVLAASINAISLALLDAGIPMKYMAAAMSCMVDKSTKEVIMDPTAAELENAASVHTFAFDSINTTAHALLSDSIGDFTPDEYFACHDKCFEAAGKVHAFLRSSVEEKKRKEHQQQQMKE